MPTYHGRKAASIRANIGKNIAVERKAGVPRLAWPMASLAAMRRRLMSR